MDISAITKIDVVNITFESEDLGGGFYKDEDNNDLNFVEADIDMVIHLSKDFEEKNQTDEEVVTIATVRAEEVFDQLKHRIYVKWSYEEEVKNVFLTEQILARKEEIFTVIKGAKKETSDFLRFMSHK